jgi:hypothetical protein
MPVLPRGAPQDARWVLAQHLVFSIGLALTCSRGLPGRRGRCHEVVVGVHRPAGWPIV